MGDLVDEQNAFVRLVDGTGDDPLVSGGAELLVPSVGIVAHVAQELRLGCSGGEDERVPVQLDEHLLAGGALELPALVEGLLVQHADLVPGALEDHDLLLAVAGAGRMDLLLAGGDLGHRDLEHPAQDVLKRVAAASHLHLALAAVGAGEVGGQGVLPALLAPVPQVLGHIGRGILGLQQDTNGLGADVLLLLDLLGIEDLQERPLGVLGVLDDPDLLPRLRKVHGQGAGDHGLACSGGSDKEEVPPLLRRYLGELDGLLLPQDPVQRVGGDEDLLGGLHALQVVPGLNASLLRHDQ